MYKNKFRSRNNLCGIMVATLRKGMATRMSQRALAEKLQLIGLDIDKNAVQRIEAGKRFVTDIELAAFSKIFGVSADTLLTIPTENGF